VRQVHESQQSSSLRKQHKQRLNDVISFNLKFDVDSLNEDLCEGKPLDELREVERFRLRVVNSSSALALNQISSSHSKPKHEKNFSSRCTFSYKSFRNKSNICECLKAQRPMYQTSALKMQKKSEFGAINFRSSPPLFRDQRKSCDATLQCEWQ
jgi:hypothetical protein